MKGFFRNTSAALLLGCAGLAHGGPIDPAVIRQAVRQTVQATVRIDAAGTRAGTGAAPQQAAGSSKEENSLARRIELPREREQDSCLLDFGFDGALGGRFLSSHVLGRTQVWRYRK